MRKQARPTKYGSLGALGYTAENKPQDQAEDAVRNKRDQLLAETDVDGSE